MSAIQKISVLVAEDNPVNQEVMIAMLEDCGIRARLAQNGEEALAAMHSDSFDLILMDCQMPVLDGFAATARIRNDTRAYKDIPIVAMTANTVMQSRTECLAAGMNDFITKPVRKRDLEWILSKWLAYQSESAKRTSNMRGSYPPAQEPQAGADPHIDPVVLQNLRLVLKGKFKLMLNTFVASSERSLQHIHAALPSGDVKAIERAAHSMQAAGQIGSRPLHRLAGLTEQAAKGGELAALPDLVDQLSSELAVVKGELQSWADCP